jgi:arsenate reductase
MSGIVKLCHNPECSKSRAVLNLLKENNIKPEIIKYLEVPLSKETIEDILKKLRGKPIDVIRKNENYFITNKLGNKKLTRSELIEIIIQNPILLERPIVIANNKAVVGRPPVSVLEII